MIKPNRILILNDYIDLSFSGYYDSKDGMVEPTCEQFNLWEKAGKPVNVLGVIMRVKL